MNLSYILNELGEDREDYFQAVAPPIVQTSNFAYRDVPAFREALANEFDAHLYSRGKNPTITILRKKLAALDEAEDALVFSSGMAAIFCAVLSQVKSGDHIVSVQNLYPWTDKLFNKILPRFGVTASLVDGTLVSNFEQALRPNTRILYLESPGSFTFELQDIAAVAALAKSRGILTMIDNSYCSPLYQKPIPVGIDISLQTATKYLGGHSDVVAGVVAGSATIIRSMFSPDFMTIGSTIAPFDAWLLLRSLRTLEVRLARVAQSTLRVAAFLEQHPAIERLYYPFSPSHPQIELARAQMKEAPGLLTVALKATRVEDIEKFCGALRHFLMAVSWGGHESLAMPMCATIPRQDFDASNIRHRMVRLYIGLEDPDYLIADIQQALG